MVIIEVPLLVVLMVKNLPANASEGDMRDVGSIPGLIRSPGEGDNYPLQYSDLENSLNYSPWGCKELDMSFTYTINLGKLPEMVRAREAWRAAVHGVTESWI